MWSAGDGKKAVKVVSAVGTRHLAFRCERVVYNVALYDGLGDRERGKQAAWASEGVRTPPYYGPHAVTHIDIQVLLPFGSRDVYLGDAFPVASPAPGVAVAGAGAHWRIQGRTRQTMLPELVLRPMSLKEAE